MDLRFGTNIITAFVEQYFTRRNDLLWASNQKNIADEALLMFGSYSLSKKIHNRHSDQVKKEANVWFEEML